MAGVEPDVLLNVENISKKFCKSLKKSLWYGVKDIAGEVLNGKPERERLRPSEFWAVEDISFKLRRGDCLGIIGRNGAGKSTLLKMINGLIKPDRGRITIKGRVGALIELGSGFNPVLTGRENIYVNGSVLGLTRKEIDKKLHAIVEFAEIGDFLETPLQYYSSGMKVRLGFAVASQMEPDVMIIDEVLAVGDVGFRAKCFNAIAKLSRKTAIIFVSHSMPQVARVCTDICVMDDGTSIYQGNNVPLGINAYFSQFEHMKGVLTGNGKAIINSIRFGTKEKEDVGQINYLDDLAVHLYISVDSDVKHPVVGITFLSQELNMIAQCVSSHHSVKITNSWKPLHIALNFPALNLNPGNYSLSVFVFDEDQTEVLTHHFAVKELLVSGNFVGSAPVQLVGEWYID